MEFLNGEWEVKRLSESGVFAGYASVFHVVDGQKDVILPGAFRKTLAKRAHRQQAEVKLLWQHAPQEPVGVFTDIREDAVGLYVEGRLLLEVQRAREAYALLKSGALEGLSIGFRVVDYEIGADGVRHIKEVELLEISLVTFPANQSAKVVSVKAGAKKPETLREMEALLRVAGFSHRQARDIALKGFVTDETMLLHAIERAQAILRG